MTPGNRNLSITVYFSSSNETKNIECHTLADGTFTASIQTERTEDWEVRAGFLGDGLIYPSSSQSLKITVEEPTFIMKYSLYIGGGAAVAAIVGVIVYMKKFKQ